MIFQNEKSFDKTHTNQNKIILRKKENLKSNSKNCKFIIEKMH